jgi:ATP-binding cassette subfamily C protein
VKYAFANVLKPLVTLAAEVAVTVGIVALLFFVNPLAAFGGLTIVGLLSWGIARLTRNRLTMLGGIRAEEQTRKYQLMQEGLGAIKEIRVLGREGYFFDGFERSERRYVHTLRDSHLLGQYPRLAIEIVAVTTLAGITMLLLLSGRELAEALATLVVFGVAVVRLVPAASKITSGLNQIRFYARSVSIVNADRRLAEEADRQARALNAGPPLGFERDLQLDDVSYRYPDAATEALKNLTVTIRKGESVGFVGASAAGKTTLLHILLGLLQPSSGRILVDGTDVRQNLGSWQRRIGFIPQDLFLLDDTIRRNVAFGIPEEEIDDDAVWCALEAAQLSSSIGNLDAGLDALTGERGTRMSGGQGQRVAIARALYHDPDVLILDEATSSLDYETEARIVACLQALAGQKTLIIVSHRHRAVRDCDVVHLLDGGHLVASGKFEEVMSSAI